MTYIIGVIEGFSIPRDKEKERDFFFYISSSLYVFEIHFYIWIFLSLYFSRKMNWPRGWSRVEEMLGTGEVRKQRGVID